MTHQFEVETIGTTAYTDQKPGTSGLRKRVKVFQQKNYVENFVQATLTAANLKPGATLVLGGDGRYYSDVVIQATIRLAAANGVGKLLIGSNGILSTPAVSDLIRKHKCDGGIILTASHNAGGPDNDFGIKYNMSNGGPAPEVVTTRIYEVASGLKEFKSCALSAVNLDKIGQYTFEVKANGTFEVEIIDGVQQYVELMKTIFPFDIIKKFLHQKNFSVLFDGMHGVTGPYGHALFCQELGLSESSLMRCNPLPDFGHGHPDPNLTYAHLLVEKVQKEHIQFGAASDGDGDRNMIISHDAFVNPSDSVAVIAANFKCIPFFGGQLKGVARSMPTSMAVDRVAEKMGVACYEVPTGWKFFGNLMDAGKLSVCGEESFGTGSDHIREKDGLWAILAWLTIVADRNLNSTSLVTVKDILTEHYKIYGRNYFTRYDYEDVESSKAAFVFEHLNKQLEEKKLVQGSKFGGFVVQNCDNFQYLDPIDQSKTMNQGFRLIFEYGSRLVFRLSGTGSQGATIRLYAELYKSSGYEADVTEVIKPLVEVAMQVSKLQELTGRTKPTVIT